MKQRERPSGLSGWVAIFSTALVLGGFVDAAAQSARGALISVLPETAGLREGDKDALFGLFQAQTTTFPIGSSAGGFTWSFDPALGIPSRRSRSLGPMFAERPQTTGRHRLSASVGFQRTEWQAMAGQDLETGIDFAYLDEDGWFQYQSQFKLTTEQTVVTTMFGIFDRVDLGVQVPYVRQRLSGTLFDTCAFCDGWSSTSITGTSSGLGDVTVRSKFAIPARGMDLATAVDLRLPTGDEQKLLGSGNTQLTAMLIGGGQSGEIATHFNVGYTFGGPGLAYPDRLEQGDFHPSDELKYAIGAEFTASTRVTIAGDIIGRTMFKAAKPVMYSIPGFASGLTVERDTVNLLLGAVSVKFLISGMWLFNTAVAFPLNDNGIQPGITPVVGFERAF